MQTLSEKRMSLLTKPEAELVLDSDPRNVRELDARQLRTRIHRARRMISKYEGQARTQHREATGKVSPSRSRRAQGADNTRTKTRYFEQSLARFEKQLERVEKQQEKARPHAPGTRSTRARAGAAKRSTTSSPRAVKRSAPEERAWRATRAAVKAQAPAKRGTRTTAKAGAANGASADRRKAAAAASSKASHAKAAPARRSSAPTATKKTGASKVAASARRKAATPTTSKPARGRVASSTPAGHTQAKPAARRTKASATSAAAKSHTTKATATARKGVSPQRKGGARKLKQNLVTQRQARAGGRGRQTQARKDAR